jgi:hypothetical protein
VGLSYLSEEKTMKKIFRPVLTCLTLLTLIFGAPGTVVASADPLQAQKTSLERLLNADGTLNLNDGFNGAIDLAGWNVQIDPQREPIFAPELAAPGQWASVGASSNGSIDSYVYAIAISGTNVYVGGNFTDAGNNGMADYIAKWNGSNWSALGSNGAGNGSLNFAVHRLAVSGTNLYLGGNFTNVNNNGTILPAADYIVKWDDSNWSALGSNGAGDGAINHIVDAIVVNGSSVFVGGYFTDISNNGAILPAADYVAKWNGTNWSALGSNGAGNGSLKYEVHALAVGGANLYVGGAFVNVNNKGTVLYAADHFAAYGLGAVPTAAPSPSPTRTVTKTMTVTQTLTVGASPTLATLTESPSPSPTGTMTAIATPTVTATPSPSPSPTETMTETPTVTPTP